MRCPSCGTENAPDSRFCGVCGAKQAPPGRLAPTAKIPDDATFPQPAPQTGQRAQIQQGYQQGPASIPPQPSPYAGPASIPPSSSPASIPPTSTGPKSIPPHAYQRAATPVPVDSQRVTPLPPELRGQDPNFAQRAPARVPAPAGSMAGESFAVPPQRPLGLIAIVLVIDLALAGSGAVMLSKGLAKKKPADAPTPTAPEMQQRSEVTPAPTPTPPPTPSPSPTEAVAAAAPPPPAAPVTTAATPVIEAKPDKTQTRDKDKKTKGSSSTKSGGAVTSPTTGPTTSPTAGPTTSPSGPITDPGNDSAAAGPAGFDLKGEANKLASSSGDLFTRCLAAAGTVHGLIKIAYQINPDGSVAHPFAVENSTSNEQLGQCLADVIATWRFSAHAGEVQNAVRPFTYP